LYSAYMLTNR